MSLLSRIDACGQFQSITADCQCPHHMWYAIGQTRAGLAGVVDAFPISHISKTLNFISLQGRQQTKL